jgi:hypothetical protein
LASQSRQIHKWVYDAVFTPTGQSAIALPGITRVEGTAASTEEKTQVANNEFHDHSVTQVREHSIRAVCQDVEKWDSTGVDKLYESLVGAFACKNTNEVNGSDETHTWNVAKITNITTAMEAGSGAQVINIDMDVYPSDGTTSPLTKS